MNNRKAVIATVVSLTTLVIASTLVTNAAGPSPQAKYVGTNKCRMCHLKEHKTWQVTKHASNFDVLEGDEVKNAECLKCHTTGYGLPGGFVSVEATPDLKSTGCEACHGPGSEHIEAGKVADKTGPWDKKINKVPQNACIECHNPHVSQKERVAKLRAEKAGK